MRIYSIIYLVFIFQAACAELPTQVNNQPLPSLAPMLEKVLPAVVNISSTQTNSSYNPLFNDPFFQRFFNIPEQRKEKQSRGSGVIIDAKAGHVITNNHVIDKADEISITLLNGEQINAELIGTDPETDIALLQVPPEKLTSINLADSSQLRVGDFVVAIGNPFGLGQTVTSGIISALGRSGLGIEGYEDFIQTDASINPGNSGGALVNLNGELIGINTAIIAPGGGNVGIGFAIPSNMVEQVIGHLMEFGEMQRGQLGIKLQELTPKLATAFGITDNKGAVISKVEPETAAAKAGLKSGDVIIAINNKTINSATDVKNRIGLLRIGEQVKVTVIRGGKTYNFYAIIADSKLKGGTISLYLKGAILKDSSDGIQIKEVTENSNAWKIGFRKDDVIIGFNRREINSIEDLAYYFERYNTRSIQIRRDGNILSVWLN
ncbi:Do family serine endopeptidase [Candidatus Halobeggiatoa sp. HSG11]|nr:Do family serine endopeptidase [Candidatus Halobeggiatoa sp. HSG11]